LSSPQSCRIVGMELADSYAAFGFEAGIARAAYVPDRVDHDGC